MTEISDNIVDDYEGLKQKSPHLFNGISQPITSKIAEGDGMFISGQGEYYALCGLNAVQNIKQALEINKCQISDITNILDFACGYGRVARVINAAFPKASLTVCDTDPKAVDAVSSILPVEGLVGSIDLDNFDIEKQFDLIWVGSLFTHIKSEYAETVFKFLSRHLSQGGVVVFSTHGPYVSERVRTREKIYGLEESQVDKFVNDYDDSGYGFSAYLGQTDYGISITKPYYMGELVESQTGLRQLMYIERGWVVHQDIMAFTKI